VIDESPRPGAGWACTGILVLAGFLSGTASPAPSPSIVGKDAPDFVLKSLDGKNLRLSEYRGQVVLVNFWARWDGDSRKEMPALEHLYGTYGRAGLVVLGVAVDGDMRRAGEFAKSMGVSYPILLSGNGDVGRDYQIQAMPLTILVDRNGVVRFASGGYQRGDEAAYLDHIRALLRE
jgi:peroxiredoxin